MPGAGGWPCPHPDPLSALGLDLPLRQKKSGIIPERPQSGEGSGQQSPLFFVSHCVISGPWELRYCLQYMMQFAHFPWLPRFFLGASTATHAHCSACAPPTEEEEDGRGVRMGTGAAERGGG